MALADRVTINPNSQGGTPCSLGALLARLDGPELAALDAMLGTPERRGWSAGDIFDALKAEGHDVAFRSINHHRGGRCRCKAAA